MLSRNIYMKRPDIIKWLLSLEEVGNMDVENIFSHEFDGETFDLLYQALNKK